MCGILIANTRKIIWFPTNGDNIKIVFKSNHINNRKGFMAKIRQLRNSCPPYVINRIPNIMQSSEPKPEVFHRQPVYLGSYCDIYIGEVIGDLRSPGYPYGYHNNQSCHYSIRRAASDICKVELIFHQFDISSTDRRFCDSDFVELPDRTRLCGKIPLQQRVYPFSRSKVRQLRNSCDYKTPQNAIKCDQTLSGQITTLHSTNYPQFYGPSQQCVYLVEPLDKNTCEYEIQFLNFNIESSRDYLGNCNKDFFQYPDGSRICGFSSAKTPYLTTSYPHTNNTYYNCDQIISSEIDVITSPNYPHNYPTTTRCIYTFLKSMPNTTRPGFRLRAEQILNSCTHPVIDHRIGNTIVGKPIVEQIPLDPVVVSQPRDPVVIKNPITQPPINTIKPLPQICSSSSTILSTFQSDNYPLPYNAYTNCVYKIFRASRHVCRLEITFLDFDVGVEDMDHKYCSNGYVEFDAIKYCGRRKEERIVVDLPADKHEFNIRFHTESSVRYGGFRIQVRQIDDNCGHHNSIQHEFSPGSTESCSKMQFSERSLQILSPHYESGSYQPFLDCEYNVRKATHDICALEVKFDAFSLEESKNCYKDYLQIGSMRLCGKLPYAATRTYQFTSDEIPIKFHTDANGNEAGFVIMVKQIQC
ncbi:unnamed protein product [Oppiella nova]|uniref:CUB domain-containing protein n=1 Tax=Oppiella nova TaxID=334625 RepID=A0A7R9M6G8_9ACAR|nr:unnamed protein product [Oppiella nova]CAG2170483.1 unnamed protein product [Oppiella nova]